MAYSYASKHIIPRAPKKFGKEIAKDFANIAELLKPRPRANIPRSEQSPLEKTRREDFAENISNAASTAVGITLNSVIGAHNLPPAHTVPQVAANVATIVTMMAINLIMLRAGLLFLGSAGRAARHLEKINAARPQFVGDVSEALQTLDS